jgi:hypothetical protein
MYAYKRFDDILKSFIRNRAYPQGSMVQWYYIEEVVEWILNYADLSNPIGVPKSRHKGWLTGKGTIGKKYITPDLNLFHSTHFHVLQHMSIVSEYMDEHKEVLLRDIMVSKRTQEKIHWLVPRSDFLIGYSYKWIPKKIGTWPYIHRFDISRVLT